MKPFKIRKLREILVADTVTIPGGEYTIGATEDHQSLLRHDNNLLCRLMTNQVRSVKLDSFVIGKFPVTNEQFEILFPKHKRSRCGSKDCHPVVDVTFYEAQAFCHKLDVRLPTEEEWEAATTEVKSGDKSLSIVKKSVNCWPSSGLNLKGEFPPNSFGLFDMRGNVYEMMNNLVKFDNSIEMVPIRGGSWGTCWFGSIVSLRAFCDPLLRSDRIGFRIALDMKL